MKHDFTPWLQYIPDTTALQDRRVHKWFTLIFLKLEQLGFGLENPEDIIEGRDLRFSVNGALFVTSRSVRTPVAGESPGVYWLSPDEAHEGILTHRSPWGLVLQAILEIAPNE